MTEEEKKVSREIRKEVEDMLQFKETLGKVIKVVCYVIGLIVGIKCYFMNDDYGLLVDVLATGILMKIIEWVVFGVLGCFIDI